MRQRSNVILEYGVYMLAYPISYIASLAGMHVVSGLGLILVSLYLYVHWYKETGNLVDLRGLFTLAWVGGQGIACFQLSKLQTNWSYLTWICLFLIYLCFGLGYEWKLKDGRIGNGFDAASINGNRIVHCIHALGIISAAALIIEISIRGFVPLLSDKPHAYSTFSVTGVHYLTISCILIPAITILVYCLKVQVSKKQKIIIGIWNIYAIAVPIICVSRFQLLFLVGFAAVIYVIFNNKRIKKVVIILLLIMIPAYVLLTIARNHDVAYLNSIFEMKNSNMPIFITQPYMYVANNFENFNQLVIRIEEFSYGLRMLFPVIALSGLKFAFPGLVNQPIYINKPELTTVTMFYDAYYDFGIFGVVILAIVIGMIARKIVIMTRNSNNPIIYMFYGQFAIYMGLAFFTTWFSNPTTWFWFAVTFVIYIYVGKVNNNRFREDSEKCQEGDVIGEVDAKEVGQ
ncbi:MAG: O-antigen polymerase [Suipraeoptans sp.]